MKRRLAAIMAADVVGYSRLVGNEEAGTVAAFKAHLSELIDPKIAEHSGRIVKTSGDGFLAEFPSVVAAVQCAVEVQNGMSARNVDIPELKRLKLRIGINVGDILSDGDDIFGDGVNVAARLEGLCEPEGVLISSGAYEQVRNKLPFDFEDIGPQALKNINQPVHAFRVRLIQIPASASPPPLADKPSIAVLPFENMSGDPEHQYFSDGITEDIITELSRFRHLFVIARNSSFVFRDKPVEVGEIGRRLGVRYLVEGSVRRAGDRIRITAQLIDTNSGVHLWADRYDRELKDLFAVQDEVAHTVASTLADRVSSAAMGHARRKSTDSLTAYDCYLRGLDHYQHFTDEDMARARELLERAIALDPGFSHAYAYLAFIHIEEWYETGSSMALDTAYKLARKAVALDSTEGTGHGALGFAYFAKRQFERAEAHLQQAITLNTNDSNAAALLIDFYATVGQPSEALQWAERAMRLNPYHPDWYDTFYAHALYVARRYSEAADAVKRVTTSQYWGHAIAAASCAMAERADEARAHVAELLVKRPGFSSRSFVSIVPYKNEGDAAHMLEGLLRAGLPA